MAIKFIRENEINIALTRLIDDANIYLYLISPFIKLHERLKRDLKNKIDNHNLKIVVVFGKNESGLQKSLSKDDFEFLTQFPNIEIKYEEKLHAKYYASEDRAIITSMNLHEYSQNNNIEAGIMMDVKGFASILSSGNDPEFDALNYFENVINNASLKFIKTPKIKKGILGLTSEYVGTDTIENYMDEIYNPKPIGFKVFNNSDNKSEAYCIRTGISIPFNIKKPYSDTAFASWKRFNNEEYKEKYCHFSGEESKGETCFKSPILKKNWRVAKQKFGF